MAGKGKKRKGKGKDRRKGQSKVILEDRSMPGDVHLECRMVTLIGDLKIAGEAIDCARKMLAEERYTQAEAQMDVAVAWMGVDVVERTYRIKRVLRAWEEAGSAE